MDVFSLLNWIYPVIDLVVIIFSLVYIRHTIGVLFAVAFGLNLLMSIAWQLPEILIQLDIDISHVYNMLSGFNILTQLIFAGLIIAAIIKISELLKLTQSND